MNDTPKLLLLLLVTAACLLGIGHASLARTESLMHGVVAEHDDSPPRASESSRVVDRAAASLAIEVPSHPNATSQRSGPRASPADALLAQIAALRNVLTWIGLAFLAALLTLGILLGRAWTARRTISDRLRAAEERERTRDAESVAKLRSMTADLERHIRERTADLKRSNEELEQFAYVASHDLQEPLRMVASYVQLLERRYREHLDEPAREFIAFAVDGTVRMKRLINDLLTYSRVGTRRRENTTVDLEVVLDHVKSNLQVAIEESGAEIAFDALPHVSGDEVQLTQLLQNIIGNAIKYRASRAPRISLGAAEAGEHWKVWVRDNGIGIDAKYADRVFGVFQRLHNAAEYDGTGIGLAICKKIVTGHGGRIWLDSKPGDGSTFFFTLPKTTAATLPLIPA